MRPVLRIVQIIILGLQFKSLLTISDDNSSLVFRLKVYASQRFLLFMKVGLTFAYLNFDKAGEIKRFRIYDNPSTGHDLQTTSLGPDPSSCLVQTVILILYSLVLGSNKEQTH